MNPTVFTPPRVPGIRSGQILETREQFRLTVRYPDKRSGRASDDSKWYASHRDAFRCGSQASRYYVDQVLLGGEEEPNGEEEQRNKG